MRERGCQVPSWVELGVSAKENTAVNFLFRAWSVLDQGKFST